MNRKDYYGDTFERIDFSKDGLDIGDYDSCTFINCNFSGTSLNESRFTDCQFADCNLSLISVIDTSFSDVEFKDCKMLGIHFEQCNEYNLTFKATACIFNHSSWYGRSIKNTHFKDCKLVEVDFANANLSGCVFDNCDFQGALFDNTNLEKADLGTSVHITLHPLQNRLKKTKFPLSEVATLMEYIGIQLVNS